MMKNDDVRLLKNSKRLKIFGKPSIKDKDLSEALIKSNTSKYPIAPKNL